MDVQAVAKGWRALVEQNLDFDLVRNRGGGRKRMKKTPEVIEAIK